MDASRMRGYRYLLYRGYLDTRRLAWLPLRGFRKWLPIRTPGDAAYLEHVVAIGHWLHNLALFSALEFEDFDEEWFWSEYDTLVTRYPGDPFDHYRAHFEREVSGAV